jgi:hypothetical protein
VYDEAKSLWRVRFGRGGSQGARLGRGTSQREQGEFRQVYKLVPFFLATAAANLKLDISYLYHFRYPILNFPLLISACHSILIILKSDLSFFSLEPGKFVLF